MSGYPVRRAPPAFADIGSAAFVPTRARVLLLGGAGEGLTLARQLTPDDTYSVAGLGRIPGDLPCAVRVGGFGGPRGLADFLRREAIALLIDATHPYAARMSLHAEAASRMADVPCWALRRPAWRPGVGDDWREVDDWSGLRAAVARFRRPLWTLGREPLAHLDEIPPSQHWTVRCLDPHPGDARATVIDARGPFSLDSERTLFAAYAIDVLVSKNSGGTATEAKLTVARERGLPVVMLRRPPLPAGTRDFTRVAELAEALAHWRARAHRTPSSVSARDRDP